MVDNHWAQSFDARGELYEYQDAAEIILNKLAFVSKTKPDGTTKRKLIWDLTVQSQFAHTPRRTHNPPTRVRFHRGHTTRCFGSKNICNEPQFRDDSSIWLFGIDISDAFHQILLNDREKRFAVASINNKFWAFRCLVLGSGSAPTAWGRFAAFLGRSIAAIAADNFRVRIYVDDPTLACRGTMNHFATQFAIALLWASVLGYPLAWREADGGRP
jgi:hypothetical protein